MRHWLSTRCWGALVCAIVGHPPMVWCYELWSVDPQLGPYRISVLTCPRCEGVGAVVSELGSEDRR
jgi:hypothetical protein